MISQVYEDAWKIRTQPEHFGQTRKRTFSQEPRLFFTFDLSGLATKDLAVVFDCFANSFNEYRNYNATLAFVLPPDTSGIVLPDGFQVVESVQTIRTRVNEFIRGR